MAKKVTARRTQLLSTYGVGSLFPAENSSYLIAGLHHWDDRYLPPVTEPRLTRQLGVGELKAPPATPDNRTKPGVPVTLFPRILQCPECGSLGTLAQLRASGVDPQCGICGTRALLIPSRFISACKAGHLSDFPYYEWVHDAEFPTSSWRGAQYPTGDPSKADPSSHLLRLRSRGRTSALADLVVECSCKRSRSLDKAFNRTATKAFRCSGERPWLGFAYTESKCGEDRSTVQRGASNVWFAVSSSAISIPPYSGKAASIVNRHFHSLKTLSREKLEAAAESGIDESLQFVLSGEHANLDVRAFARQVLETIYPDSRPAVTDEEFRFQEFQALMDGSDEEPESQFTCRPEAVGEEISTWVKAVRRVSRLREVRALSGFTRITASEQQADGDEASQAALRPEDDNSSWLPATELLGEGLFIALDRDRLDKWSGTPFVRSRIEMLQKNADEAARRRADRSGEDFIPKQIDSAYVALHTLSHALIDQLALEAGYPASSLKERLFVGANMAGILVYTASADSAGSLGGVASMADSARLSAAMAEAEDRLSWCSADPVCLESTGNGVDGANLAACHNCVLLPETSCEGFNVGLDRGLIFGTPENPDQGLISWLRARPRVVPKVDIAPIDPAINVPDVVAGTSWLGLWEATDRFKYAITSLADEEAELPQYGVEVGIEQITVDFTWIDKRIILTELLGSEDTESLEEQGWTVVTAEDGHDDDHLVDQILTELR
ncbi:DrmB family protein [Brevibacterium aurantiacum]|uniref:DrmB family protein n=1 Tax=Brevibacterium aurantiacum TaxID=273384 RepID=UPI0003069884|nr:DUF1998 domain-containing protein [Brevibacterium aurantiacum]